jgi:hypothetical protein
MLFNYEIWILVGIIIEDASVLNILNANKTNICVGSMIKPKVNIQNSIISLLLLKYLSFKLPTAPTAVGEHSPQNTVKCAQCLYSNSWRR